MSCITPEKSLLERSASRSSPSFLAQDATSRLQTAETAPMGGELSILHSTASPATSPGRTIGLGNGEAGTLFAGQKNRTCSTPHLSTVVASELTIARGHQPMFPRSLAWGCEGSPSWCKILTLGPSLDRLAVMFRRFLQGRSTYLRFEVSVDGFRQPATGSRWVQTAGETQPSGGILKHERHYRVST
jgi:hypothetical protein